VGDLAFFKITQFTRDVQYYIFLETIWVFVHAFSCSFVSDELRLNDWLLWPPAGFNLWSPLAAALRAASSEGTAGLWSAGLMRGALAIGDRTLGECAAAAGDTPRDPRGRSPFLLCESLFPREL
jgi:hypothetical protein